uniref:THAP-type domain-containing protein n=1 Tax=Amphimedon queenslandica TaxID=400682 RepID=A0A1X7TY70_AMPQE
MPIRCVAGGCSNSYKGVSFLNFPNEQPRRIWISKVQTTRAKWTVTEHSKLYSAHFTDDYFETELALYASMGIDRRKRLKPTAVPSLFSHQTRNPQTRR